MQKAIKLNWNYRFGTQGGGDLDSSELCIRRLFYRYHIGALMTDTHLALVEPVVSSLDELDLQRPRV
jgi:hypothetical protein